MKSRLERLRNRVYMIFGATLFVFFNIDSIGLNANIYGLFAMTIYVCACLFWEKRVIVSLDENFPEVFKKRLEVIEMVSDKCCVCKTPYGDIKVTDFIEV